MPTLQDVAKKAGVSTATVSKVLSNTPYVSDATKAKVLEAVEALGYRPNLAARALSSGKTHIIAVVFPYIYDAIFKDPLVMAILEGVEAVCNEQHYNILLSTPRVHENLPDEHYHQLLQSGYIEGLIAIDNIEAVSFAAAAEQMNIPTVVLGHHTGSFKVQSDNLLGGKLLMQAVIEAGHEAIGLISVLLEMNIAIGERVAGMMEALQDAGMSQDLPVVLSDFSTRGGAEAAQKLLAYYPDLTAIVCVNDRMAIGALNQMKQIGKVVPDEISVVGYDNISMATSTQPRLTTIDQKPVELGRAAAELLFMRLNGKKPSIVIVEPELVLRESLGKRR